jgi:hypothetical protein
MSCPSIFIIYDFHDFFQTLYISLYIANNNFERMMKMNTVPVMISTKDLEYIKDMLNWNLIAAKKATHYLEHIEDQEVADLITQISDMHKQHYNTLLNLLNQGGQNEQQQ